MIWLPIAHPSGSGSSYRNRKHDGVLGNCAKEQLGVTGTISTAPPGLVILHIPLLIFNPLLTDCCHKSIIQFVHFPPSTQRASLRTMFENISSVFSLLFGPTSKVIAPTGPGESPEAKAMAETSTRPAAWQIPPSSWPSLCHRDEERVTHEVNKYFLQEWKFPNQKARDTFVKGGFCRITCLYFPRAKEDRIHFACRLLTLLFLIDGTVLPLAQLAKWTQGN